MYAHDFILLDASGSMDTMWGEALNGINRYVRKLADDNVDTGVTVAVFDSGWNGGLNFRIIRDRITPKTFRPITNNDARPGGGTPLSDAVGKIVQMAEHGGYDRVAMVIMTDGEENSSKEYSVADAKSALARLERRDWPVFFLGANFQNERQATSYGVQQNFRTTTTVHNMSDTFELLGSKRGLYAATGASASMSFNSMEQAATESADGAALKNIINVNVNVPKASGETPAADINVKTEN